jgi:hypothetical protein
MRAARCCGRRCARPVSRRLVPPAACVLELGAGYGYFINHIRCNRRIAVDKWPGFLRYVNSDVIAHVGEVTDLSFIADSSVDFVFASNLVEHLTQGEFATVLGRVAEEAQAGRDAQPAPTEL